MSSAAKPPFHEADDLLSERTKDLHRALTSLGEELEAVDWYQQRAEGTKDPELRAVLEHNRDEETEHAMMLLEWLRRRSPVFDENIRSYLLKVGPITGLEASHQGAAAGAAAKELAGGESPTCGDASLDIGSLKGK